MLKVLSGEPLYSLPQIMQLECSRDRSNAVQHVTRVELAAGR
jgi:hypothetical protein